MQRSSLVCVARLIGVCPICQEKLCNFDYSLFAFLAKYVQRSHSYPVDSINICICLFKEKLDDTVPAVPAGLVQWSLFQNMIVSNVGINAVVSLKQLTRRLQVAVLDSSEETFLLSFNSLTARHGVSAYYCRSSQER